VVSSPILFYIQLLPVIQACLAGLVEFDGDKGIEELVMVKIRFNCPSYCEMLAKAHDKVDLLGV
jgi:hypothetical protein